MTVAEESKETADKTRKFWVLAESSRQKFSQSCQALSYFIYKTTHNIILYVWQNSIFSTTLSALLSPCEWRQMRRLKPTSNLESRVNWVWVTRACVSFKRELGNAVRTALLRGYFWRSGSPSSKQEWWPCVSCHILAVGYHSFLLHIFIGGQVKSIITFTTWKQILSM